jgi:hypothetical protein
VGVNFFNMNMHLCWINMTNHMYSNKRSGLKLKGHVCNLCCTQLTLVWARNEPNSIIA